MSREVGLLSRRGHPLLGPFLTEFARHPKIVPIVLADTIGFTSDPGELARFAERTNGAFSACPVPDVEIIDVEDHNGPDVREILRSRGITYVANGGTSRRIGRRLLAAATGGIVNAHPGILPKYRGASCPERAIQNDDPVGVTAHFMDEGLDSGPIIATEFLDVRRGWDYVAVRVALYRLQAKMLADAVAKVVREGLTPRDLPRQPSADEFPPYPPISADELDAVKKRLAQGEYSHVR